MAENQVQEGYPEAFTLRDALEGVLEASEGLDQEFTKVSITRATPTECTYRVYTGREEYTYGGVLAF